MINYNITIPEYIGERIVNGKLFLINQKKDEVWIYNNKSIQLWEKVRNMELLDELTENNKELFLKSLYERGLINCDPVPQDFERKPNLVPYNRQFHMLYEIYKAHTLHNAMFEVTYRCNEKCSHCYISSVPDGELTFDEVTRVVDELKEMGCHLIHLTGGEIFCRKDIFDIIDYCQTQGFLIGLFTNGSLVTEEIADKISERFISFVKISLYGTTQQSHECITKVKGSFEKSMNAIQLLKNRGQEVSVGFTLMKHNAKELYEADEFCDKLGVKYNIEMRIFPRHDNSNIPLEYAASDEDVKLFLREKRISTITETICLAGQTKMKINPSGDIYPCEFWRYPVGNVREKSLIDIWNSDELKAIVDKIRNYRPDECRSCELQKDCFVCPAFYDFEESGFSKEFCRWANLNAVDI